MAPSVMASSATSVAPFLGLKSSAGLPVSRRSNSTSFGKVSNGGRIKCMQVIINKIYSLHSINIVVSDNENRLENNYKLMSEQQ
jgi:hypothetical protein